MLSCGSRAQSASFDDNSSGVTSKGNIFLGNASCANYSKRNAFSFGNAGPVALQQTDVA